MHFYRPNVVSLKLVTENQQTPLIGPYLPLSTLYHLTYLEEVLNRFLVRDPIVLGDLDPDIVHLRNFWYQQVADFLESFGLVNILAHFQQRLCYPSLQTW